LIFSHNLTRAAVTAFTSATSCSIPPDSAYDSTGAEIELSGAGSHNLGYNNASGATVKLTANDVYAAVVLATGQLKSRASLSFGTDVSGAPVPVNRATGSASPSSASATASPMCR
jgi:hypothetical protein